MWSRPDVPVAERERLAQRELERLLRLRAHPHVAAAAAPPRQRPRPERLLDRAAHRLEVDADRGQRVRVELLRRGADRRLQLAVPESQRRRKPAARRDPEQQVLRAEVVVAERGGLLVRARHHVARVPREAVEHQRTLRNTLDGSAVVGHREPAAAVLLVHRLAADAERVGDLLPAPAALARVLDLQLLERLEQRPQRRDRGQPDGRVAARRGVRQLRCLVHACQPTLTPTHLSTSVDGSRSG